MRRHISKARALRDIPRFLEQAEELLLYLMALLYAEFLQVLLLDFSLHRDPLYKTDYHEHTRYRTLVQSMQAQDMYRRFSHLRTAAAIRTAGLNNVSSKTLQYGCFPAMIHNASK